MDAKTARELSMKVRFHSVEVKIANSDENIREAAEKGRLSLLYSFDYDVSAQYAYDKLKKKHPDFSVKRYESHEFAHAIVISW